MGFLEKIIVTPSHHRVHHAINKEYLDKNYSQIFIFWDKWFGTFQEELPTVPAVYGITRPVQTWNPIKINFMHLALLIKDAWRTKNWKDKFRIWLMHTGWRPADVVEKYPVFKINDVYHFEKYQTKNSGLFSAWIWLQLLVLLLLVSYLFGNIASIGSPQIFIYGAFIFSYVYAYTEMMDHSKQAWIWDFLKTLFGLTLLINNQDWFGASSYSSLIPYLFGIYLLLSSVVCIYFQFIEKSISDPVPH